MVRIRLVVLALCVLTVSSVEARPTSYSARRESTRGADGFLRLATWCREQRLFSEEKEALILALRADAQHGKAKRRLSAVLAAEERHRAYNDPWRRENPSFVVETDTNEARLHEVCDVVTAFCRKFRAIFKVDQTPRQRWGRRIRVRLFRDQRGFDRYRRQSGLRGLNKGAQGYYNFERKEIVLWEVPGDPEATIQTLLHEGTHLFLHLALGPEARRLPLWLNEGIAEYFGAAKYDARRNALVAVGRPPYHQVLLTQRMLKKDGGLRVAELIGFRNQPHFDPPYYARSWALVHMLLEKRGKKKAHVYRKAFFRYLTDVAKGADSVERFRKTFGTTATMTSRLNRYVKNLDVPKTAEAEEAFRKGRYLTAARIFSAHLKEKPRDRKSILRMGISLGFANKFGEAAMSYKRLLRIDPDNAAAHARLGHALAMQREGPRAMRSARRAVDLKPTHENYYYLAMVAYMTNDKEKAVGAIGRALVLGGEQSEYVELQGRIRGM